MIITFAYPSSTARTAGVQVLYEFAGALARRGHSVRFVHGPSWPGRISSLEELEPFGFDPAVEHLLVDSLDDPVIEPGDVAFSPVLPRRVGLPATILQGHRLLPEEMEAESYRQPGLKVCVARWLVDVAIAYGVSRHRIVHVPVGLDHSTFSCDTTPEERDLDLAVLYHPFPAKGWDVGRAVLEHLAAQRPLRAVVFGRDAPLGRLPSGVDLLVDVDHATLVEEVYGRTKVFVQASHYEGFGYTAVEAMACGAALATTDNGGSRDYALDGETAVVVPPGDPGALAAAAADLLDDGAKRCRLARAGERFVRRFDWDQSGEILEGHLERYLADPAPYLEP